MGQDLLGETTLGPSDRTLYETEHFGSIYRDSLVIDKEKGELIPFAIESCRNHHDYLYTTNTTQKNIIIDGVIKYNSDRDFVISTEKNIIFTKNAKVINEGSGSIILRAGMNNYADISYTVKFESLEPQIVLTCNSCDNKVKIYYSPEQGDKNHKYYNSHDYADNIQPSYKLNAYMFVNNMRDLQAMYLLPSANYALSHDLDASITKIWDNGKGFLPVGNDKLSFSGDFDGNSFTISNLYINRPNQDYVGLFGFASSSPFAFSTIANLRISFFNITGQNSVGSLIGAAQFVTINHIVAYEKDYVTGFNYTGGLVGQEIAVRKY